MTLRALSGGGSFRRLRFAPNSSGPTPDPYYDWVVFLLHFNGIEGSTTIVDEKSHAFTVGGDAHLTTINPKFTTACLTLDGNGDYVKSVSNDDWGIASSRPFAVEGWLYPTNALDEDSVWCAVNAASGFQIGRKSATEWGIAENGVAWVLFSTILPTLNTWNFIQVTRDESNIIKLGLNGIVIAISGADNRAFIKGDLYLGVGSPGSNPFAGKEDEWRFTNGMTRDISGVPTQPFANSSSLLDISGPVGAASFTASWTIPTTDADGNPLVGSILYQMIMYGTNGTTYPYIKYIRNGTSTSTTISSLAIGTYYIVYSCVDTGGNTSYTSSQTTVVAA